MSFCGVQLCDLLSMMLQICHLVVLTNLHAAINFFMWQVCLDDGRLSCEQLNAFKTLYKLIVCIN